MSGDLCYCSCLPHLPGFACSIHATWGPSFSQALYVLHSLHSYFLAEFMRCNFYPGGSYFIDGGKEWDEIWIIPDRRSFSLKMHYFCDSLQEHAFHYFSIVSFPKCTRTLCTGLCEYALHNTIQSEKPTCIFRRWVRWQMSAKWERYVSKKILGMWTLHHTVHNINASGRKGE